VPRSAVGDGPPEWGGGLLTPCTASLLFGVDEDSLVNLSRRGVLRTVWASDDRALYTAGDLLDVVRAGLVRRSIR